MRAPGRRKPSIAIAAPQDALLDALGDEARRYGWDAIVVPTDITKREEVDRLVATAMGTFGRIDVAA